MLGRWGGDTVKRYLADAHLDIAARRATGPVPSGIDLEDLVGKVLRNELAVERAAGQLRGSADLEHLKQEVSQAALRAESDAAQRVAPLWVTNLSSGIAHRVLCVPSSSSTGGVTHCGWKFSGHRDAACPIEQPPSVYRQVCSRCDPVLRAQLKVAARTD